MSSSPRRWLPSVLTLLAGVAIGMIVMAVWIHVRLDALHHAGPEGVALHVLEDELDLDDQQSEQVRVMLHGIWDDLAKFHEAHEEELHSILAHGANGLGSILRPEQTVDWRAMHSRLVNQILVSGLMGTHDGERATLEVPVEGKSSQR